MHEVLRLPGGFGRHGPGAGAGLRLALPRHGTAPSQPPAWKRTWPRPGHPRGGDTGVPEATVGRRDYNTLGGRAQELGTTDGSRGLAFS